MVYSLRYALQCSESLSHSYGNDLVWYEETAFLFMLLDTFLYAISDVS